MKDYTLATFDCETDPFEHGAEIEPFCCGLKTADAYVSFWGLDCFEQIDRYLQGLNDQGIQLLIYAHNGGKFDYIYLIRKGLIDESKVMIVNSRIIKAYWRGHEIRDSYSIIPCPLSKMQTSAGIKHDIDYDKMKLNQREKHKAEIQTYLKQDCEVLFEAVKEFINLFGAKLTIGGTAMAEIKKTVTFDKQDKDYDAIMREFYMGGRVNAFRIGKIPEGYKYYDVNSLYPSVMASREHFCGKDIEAWHERKSWDKVKADKGTINAVKNCVNPYMIQWEGHNSAACPVKCRQTNSTSFDVPYGVFNSTSHEIKTALEYNLIDIRSVHKLYECHSPINFAEFVNTFSGLKEKAKREGDPMREVFYKILLNSGYGKFGQNPENFCDYLIVGVESIAFYLANGWTLEFDYEDFMIVSKEAESEDGYYDVGIAASITGAARAVLLDGLMVSESPIYCDTDSIICKGLKRSIIDKYKMGYWDCEAEIKSGYIAGKKMYAYTDQNGKEKTSTKGVRLSYREIEEMMRENKMMVWKNQAPTMRIDGSQTYVTRGVESGRENLTPKRLQFLV